MPDGTQGEPVPQPVQARPPGIENAPTVPEGMELVPKDELANLRRQSDSYRGQAPLVDPLLRLGIKTRDDLEKALEPVRAARELNVDLGGVLNSLRAPQPSPQQPPQALTMDDLNRVLAENEYKSSQEREDRLMTTVVSKLAGEKASDAEKRFARGLVYDLMAENTRTYESGPLRGKLRPLGEREFAEIERHASEAWQSFRGQHLQQVAASAGTARPAGLPGPGGAGAAATTHRAPGEPPTRDDVLAYVQQLQARRSGAPLSQA